MYSSEVSGGSSPTLFGGLAAVAGEVASALHRRDVQRQNVGLCYIVNERPLLITLLIWPVSGSVINPDHNTTRCRRIVSFIYWRGGSAVVYESSQKVR